MLVNRAFASSPSLMRGWNCSIGKISDTTTLADIFLLAFLAATMSTTKRVPSVDAVATLTSGIWDSFSARQDRIGRSASMSPATRSCMITSVLFVASADAQNVSNPNARSTGTIAVKYPLIACIIHPPPFFGLGVDPLRLYFPELFVPSPASSQLARYLANTREGGEFPVRVTCTAIGSDRYAGQLRRRVLPGPSRRRAR